MLGKEMDDYDKRIIRDAMLEEQSEWLTEADNADSFTMIAVAKVIAEAFEKAAAKYKTKETFSYDDTAASGAGRAWDDEHGVAPALHEAGEARGESS